MTPIEHFRLERDPDFLEFILSEFDDDFPPDETVPDESFWRELETLH
jgi:hypothetical protein